MKAKTHCQVLALALVGVATRGWADTPDSPAAGLPLAFVTNEGQWEHPARFVARRGSMVAGIGKDAIFLVRQDRQGRSVVRLSFEGACDQVVLIGEQRQAARHNYFVGARSRWRADVPSFDTVLYSGLHDGIDLRVRDHAGGLKYDVLVAPGADPSQMVIACEGVEGLAIGPDGSLVMQTSLGSIVQEPPSTWNQLPSGERLSVECRYCLIDGTSYGFEVPERDIGLPLVIDPALEWATYVGSSGDDYLTTLAADASGVVTLAGFTTPPILDPDAVFPITEGAYDEIQDKVFRDATISRLSADGSTLLWSTFLGGHLGTDRIWDLALDEATGIVTVVGDTFASDFPTTTGAYDETHNGSQDAFVASLDPSQSGLDQLVWSTFLGGVSADRGVAIELDGQDVVVAGHTSSSFDFPTTKSAYNESYNGGVADHFVARLDPSQSGEDQLVWSTYLGGSGEEGCASCSILDQGVLLDLTLGRTGDVYVAGYTGSSNFPTTPGAYDTSIVGHHREGHITHLTADGSSILWSTFIGGSGEEGVTAVRVDESGVVSACGFTYSEDFPTTPGAVDADCAGVWNDGFVVRFDPGQTGLDQLVYSTCLGGSEYFDPANDMVLHQSGIVTVTGIAGPDFPTTPDARQGTVDGIDDAFVTRMSLDPESNDNLIYSTYLGASDSDWAFTLDTVGPDDVLVGGLTFSSDLATTGAFDTVYDGGPVEWPDDGFIIRLDLCPADIDDNDDVGTTDLLALLAAWGPCPPPPPACLADLDGDGQVGTTDLLALLASWGPCL